MNTGIFVSLKEILNQLQQLLELMDDQQYQIKVKVLSSKSIGQHVRHIIEFFEELNRGYDLGHVNYDMRKRDLRIENSKSVAYCRLASIIALLNKENRQMRLETDFSSDGSRACNITTNYERELLYNLEHTVHHMALVRIGVEAVSNINLPEEFGVAMSTIKYQQLCAQ